jgi:asparagine synthase (glutamine-hydrolysing)
MCGFAGFVDHSPRDAAQRDAIARAMAGAIAHRGPDDEGVWLDGDCGIGLASRRLAIQDLSAHGHQPMTSHSGRCVIAYNGELYNVDDLRGQLAAAGVARAWRGHSDTEVLLEACEHWGVEAALQRCHGMFALALWDRARRTLTLARDRFGEKPLYYGQQGTLLLFGSELKALAAHPGFVRRLDARAIGGFLRRGFVPGPPSIYEGIRKLPPAGIVQCRLDGNDAPTQWTAARPYWSALQTAMQARSRPYASVQEAREQVDHALAAAVKSCLVADVPLGAFLSGGIDSSLIVAYMQQAASQPARTFTIAYDDARYDESAHAALVARHLGTRHEAHRVTPAEIASVIPRLPSIYDEPFADASQLPTYLVAAAARRHVTVALTGDGGDELFGGYPRYFDGQRAWRQIERLPHPLRRTLADALCAVSPGRWDSALGALRRIPGAARIETLNGPRLHRLAHALRAPDARTMYAGLMSRDTAAAARLVSHDLPEPGDDETSWDAGLDLPEAMMLADTVDVLVDDFLVKVDRAAMAVSLETRAPLLSPAVFEAAWRLPLEQRVGAASGKRILRDLLERHVPRSITDRPKQGFGIPIGRWITGSLRDWAESLLDAGSLAAGGHVDAALVRRQWQEHLAGTHDHERSLWTVLMLQAWLAGTAR